MPRLIVYGVMVLLMLALIPPVVAARTRATPSEKRPIHIIQDMDIQAKFQTQSLNRTFADQRSMRPEVVGVVARGARRRRRLRASFVLQFHCHRCF